MILTLSPERITDPSTTASTRNSLAISARDLPARLYRITDVREMTRNSLIREMAAMSSSVMPSEKYSWDGSPERLSSGSTARESMRGARGGSIEPCSSSRDTAVTWATKRYPRCGKVSMKRGLSALSPRASRSLLIALFSPRSKSTKVLSGAGGLGMGRLALARRPHETAKKQALAAVGQSLLMETWQAGFAPHGITVAQVLLTHEDLRARDRYLGVKETLAQLIGYGA